MKKTLSLFACLIVATICFTGCEKKNMESGLKAKVFNNLDATNRGKWTYFSFAKGDTISVQSPETDKTWDIAFHREQIRINGKDGYSGNGSISLTSSQDFEAVSMASATEFKGNTMAKYPSSLNHEKAKEGADPYTYSDGYFVTTSPGEFPRTASSEKNEYVSFFVNMAGHGTGGATDPLKMYIPQPHVFLVKDAAGTGTYKMKITKTVNDKGKNGGTLSFIYIKL